MNLSHAYATPPPRDVAERVLRTAVECGVTMFDTAALYGFGANEELLGAVLKPHRADIVLASKGGMFRDETGRRAIDARPDTLRRMCDDSLTRLQTDVIDLYYLHRKDPNVPIADSIGALADLVHEGKVRTIGLSEVSAATLRQAHAVHPVTAIQSEYSLWTRNPEIAVLDACRELGVTFVAFSPLARGFLCGELRNPDELEPRDIRRAMPRFAAENYAKNLRLLDEYGEIAGEAGCSRAQLALAWLLAKEPFIVPIPGTRQPSHVIDNMGAANLSPLGAPLVARLDALINQRTVAGERYNAATQQEIDTENF